jgi:uncharacterized protein (TIGR02246 family)
MDRRSLLAVVLLLGGVGCRRGTPARDGLSSEDVAAIRNSQQTWIQALQAGDWAGAAAVHTVDAVRMPPDGSDERGRAAIHRSLTKMERPSAINGTAVEIEGCGDLAYAWTTFSVAFPARAGEKSIPYTGRDIVIFRKQRDGKWLVSRVIWNSDRPPSR